MSDDRTASTPGDGFPRSRRVGYWESLVPAAAYDAEGPWWSWEDGRGWAPPAGGVRPRDHAIGRVMYDAWSRRERVGSHAARGRAVVYDDLPEGTRMGWVRHAAVLLALAAEQEGRPAPSLAATTTAPPRATTDRPHRAGDLTP